MNRCRLLIFLLAVCVIPSVAFAQSADSTDLMSLVKRLDIRGAAPHLSATKPSCRQSVLYAFNLVQMHDLNGDERLDLEEYSRLSFEWPDEYDNDANGYLTPVEMAYRLIEPRPAPSPAVKADMLQQIEIEYDQFRIEMANRRRTPFGNVNEPPNRLAATFLAQYDLDEDGTLDENEWSKIGSGWQSVDFDRDRRISTNELTIRFEAFQQSARNGDLDLDPQRRGFDLPEQYFQLDGNGDGQIQMHEFASHWSDANVDAYYRLDLNRDGVITPGEWLESRAKSGQASLARQWP